MGHARGRARSKSARARARQAAAPPPTPLPAPPRPPPRASPRESRRARALGGWSHRVSLVRGRRRAGVRGGSGWACGGRGGAPPARGVVTALFRARAQKAAPPPQRAPGARATARRHSPDSVSRRGARACDTRRVMAAPAGAAGDGDADANGVELSTAVAASFDGRSQCECAICACTLTEAPPAPAPAPAHTGDDANAAADAEDGTEDSAPVAFPAAPAWAWSSSFTFPCCHNSDCCVRCAAEWVGHQADEELRRPHPRAAPESALPADLISCPFCRSSDPVAMNNTVSERDSGDD